MSRPKLIIGATIALAVGGGVTAWVLTHPSTMDVGGTLIVPSSTAAMAQEAGMVCRPDQGYADIDFTTQVQVQNGSGATIALGDLDVPKPKGSDSCIVTFTVHNVPKGEAVYAIQIGAHPATKFPGDQVDRQGVVTIDFT